MLAFIGKALSTEDTLHAGWETVLAQGWAAHIKAWPCETGIAVPFFLMGVENDKAKELRICEVNQFMVYGEVLTQMGSVRDCASTPTANCWNDN